MIDWIDAKLRSWGAARWRQLTVEESGPQSIFGTIQDYGLYISDGWKERLFKEGLTGDALECSVAITLSMMAHELTDRQYECIFYFYVFPKKEYPLRKKLDAMGINDTTYYNLRDDAHRNIERYFLRGRENPATLYDTL